MLPACAPQARRRARFAAGTKDLKARTAAAQEALTSVSATLAGDGVQVSVDTNGALRDLHLDRRATSDGLDALARRIVTLTKRAHAQALQQAAARVGELVGADSPAVAALERQRAALSETGAPAAPHDSAVRFRPSAADDDGFDDDSFYGRGVMSGEVRHGD